MKRKRLLLVPLAVWLALGGSSATAKDMSSLYSTAELRVWHDVLEKMVRHDFDDLLSKGLDENDRRKAAGISLEMPLRGPANDVMEFYAEKRTVVIPVLSLKFLHDLLLANAWLFFNGYDTTTVDEYVAMLKYNSASWLTGGLSYPKPLDTLGIPASAIPPKDQAVSGAFFGSLSASVGFILAHELGHVILGHTSKPPGSLADRVKDEAAADDFAMGSLERAGADATSMFMYFDITASWSRTIADFPTRREFEQYLNTVRDHPLTGQRIGAIGKRVHNPRIVKLGELIDDENYARDLAIKAVALTPDNLGPRPMPPDATAPPEPRASGTPASPRSGKR